MQNNKELREAAKKSNVKLWEIAEKLCICESNFSKKLRNEFTQSEKDIALTTIENLRKEKYEILNK